MSALRVAPDDRHISLVRLSPFNLPDARRLYVILKGYCDGSSKSGYLTLAGLAASDVIWPDFETRWSEALAFHGLKWWHTTDAMSRNPGSRRDFLEDEKRHWNIIMANQALSDLRAVINRFWDERWRDGFRMFTCTVELDGYNTALSRNQLLRSEYAICVHNCWGYIGLADEDIALLYFDRGEKFKKEFEQVWTSARHHRDSIPIRPMRETFDSRLVRPLQAADLMAWEENLNSLSGSPTRFHVPNRVHSFYGLQEIEAEYTPDKERKRAEGIRRTRRRTRETRALEALEHREREKA